MVESPFLATHSDLFAYLGRHRLPEGDEVVRTLIPNAWGVILSTVKSGEVITSSEKSMNADSSLPCCPKVCPIMLNVR